MVSLLKYDIFYLLEPVSLNWWSLLTGGLVSGLKCTVKLA